MNIIEAEINPQLTMIRAIQMRAPKRCISMLLGTSKTEYPMKKIPTPKP